MQADKVLPLTRAEKLPPVALEEEEALIGCLLQNPETAIALVADSLKPEHFYTTAYRTLYEAATWLYCNGIATDLMQLTRWLKDRNRLEEIGGSKTLVALMDLFEPAPRAILYAKVISEKYQRRQAIFAAHKAIELAHTATDWDAARQEIEKAVFNLSDAASDKGLISFSELSAQMFAELERRAESGQAPGIPSGFYDLDAMTQGFRPQLCIVAGRPSMGKTALAANIARNFAVSSQLPVVLFSLEMGATEVYERMLASESRTSATDMKRGHVREWQPLIEANDALGYAPGYIDESSSITIGTIQSRCRQVKAKHGEIGGVFIDYLQLMISEGKNRVNELGEITRSLKALQRELGCPIFALSQLSRDVENRTNKRPVMSDLRDSGCIEQDADLILMLYRDEYYNPDSPERGIAEVIVVKHRNGPVGTVKLLFDPEFTQFRNLRRRHEV